MFVTRLLYNGDFKMVAVTPLFLVQLLVLLEIKVLTTTWIITHQ